MAYRKKVALLQPHKPDILVIPECEHPNKLLFDDTFPEPTSMVWYGGNLNKGLGVFSYNHYKLQLLDAHEPGYKIVLPIQVTSRNESFILFAVWANNPQDKKNRSIMEGH